MREINTEYSLEGLRLKLKLQYFGHLMQRADSLQKTLMLGKIEGRRRGAKKGEMVGWHPWLNGCEFEQTPGVSEGQGSWCAAVHGIAKSQIQLSNRATLNYEMVPLALRGASLTAHAASFVFRVTAIGWWRLRTQREMLTSFLVPCPAEAPFTCPCLWAGRTTHSTVAQEMHMCGGTFVMLRNDVYMFSEKLDLASWHCVTLKTAKEA